MKIKLIIGDKEDTMEIKGNQTVKDLLNSIDIASETVVVKKNTTIVIDEEKLEDGDLLEVIQVIYGG
jgi:sulfur carrier protein